MNMKNIFIMLLMVFSVQFVGAQNQVNSDDSDSIEYLRTKVKTEYATYIVQKGKSTFTVWRSDYDIEKDQTNVLFLEQLPKLTFFNKDKLDRYIEKILPKQPNAEEWIKDYDDILIMILADPVTGKIKHTAFGFDKELVFPIKKIAVIDKFVRENCYLVFEQTSVTRKANYIPYDYRYFFKDHELRK